MNISENKIVNFENMVIQDAEQKRTAILNELAKEKNEKLSEIQKDLRKKAVSKLKKNLDNISKTKNEQIVHNQLLCKQAVLFERQKQIDGIFDKVALRLGEFTKSEDYKTYIFDTIAKAKQKLNNATKVQIVKNDEWLLPEISALGFEVEFLENSRIGGCIIVDMANGIRIDETFSTKLESAENKFLETYNLKI